MIELKIYGLWLLYGVAIAILSSIVSVITTLKVAEIKVLREWEE